MKLKGKELLLFALYKDKPNKGVKNIENTIVKKYGFKPSKNFCREIINYQAKKYGGQIPTGNKISRFKTRSRSPQFRNQLSKTQSEIYLTQKLIERNEKMARKINVDNLKIEYDNILKKWVVWDKVGTSAFNEIYSAKTKRECKEWISEKAGKK